MPSHVPALPEGPLTLATARELGHRDHDWRCAGPRRTQTVRSATGPVTTRERAALFMLALPQDCAFSHVTAAQLWGLPLARTVQDQAGLDIIRDSGRGRIERRGCIGHRGAERRAIVTLHGLRLTGLADTWVDLGEVMGAGAGRRRPRRGRRRGGQPTADGPAGRHPGEACPSP